MKYKNTLCMLLSALFVVSLLAEPAFSYNRRTPVVETVEKVGPAVVNIRTERVIKRRSTFFGFNDPFFDQFFRDLAPPRVYKTQSLGSGIIIDTKGYILTNAHVVQKASKIYVALPDSRKELEAELVGKAERIDLAVLKIIEEREYPSISPGSSSDLFVGETVIAIGNPLGLGHSVTTGVVSAPRRRIPMKDASFSVFIQTDALINPGNSGGPLLNINGELIGINTAIIEQAQGIGFAVPINVVNRVLADLLKSGEVRRAYLGVIPGRAGKELAGGWGQGGVLVNGVDNKSPAEKAGLRYGDVIVEVEDIPVTTPVEFNSFLQTYLPGNKVRLKVLRGFDLLARDATLAAIPKGYGVHYGEGVFGFSVKASPSGLLVKNVVEGSPAAEAGIESGDRVGEVAGEKPQTVKEYGEVIERYIGREPIRFLIVRGRRGYYIDLP